MLKLFPATANLQPQVWRAFVYGFTPQLRLMGAGSAPVPPPDGGPATPAAAETQQPERSKPEPMPSIESEESDSSEERDTSVVLE